MLLGHNEIRDLIKLGVVEGAAFEHVNSATLDLTMTDEVLFQRPYDYTSDAPVDLQAKESVPTLSYPVPPEGITIWPGDFLLVGTREVFHLPDDISAEYTLKSTMARNGLEHFTAGWADAGWNGSALTMEFVNLGSWPLLFRPGMKIGQMKFFKHSAVPEGYSYRDKGQYNGDAGPQGGKELR